MSGKSSRSKTEANNGRFTISERSKVLTSVRAHRRSGSFLSRARNHLARDDRSPHSSRLNTPPVLPTRIAGGAVSETLARGRVEFSRKHFRRFHFVIRKWQIVESNRKANSSSPAPAYAGAQLKSNGRKQFEIRLSRSFLSTNTSVP